MNKQNSNQSLWIEIFIIILPVLFGFFIPSNNSFIQSMWQYYLPVTTLISYIFILYVSNSKKNPSGTLKKISHQSWFLLTLTEYILCTIYILISLNWNINVEGWTFLFLGLLFVVSGNMLPKIEQNNFMGVKVKWTLENRDNWNYTNRLTGKVWCICGFLLILASLLFPSQSWISWIFILAVVVSPFGISYFYYKKQVKENRYTKDLDSDSLSNNGKKTTILSLVCLGIALIFCVVVILLGSYTIHLTDTSIQIDARMYSDTTIPYSQIEKAEFKNGTMEGSRVFGYGSPTLKMGNYKNTSLGNYIRYTQNADAYILIETKDEDYVINEKTKEETKELFEKIIRHIPSSQ